MSDLTEFTASSAADPGISPEMMAEIARTRPDLWPALAANPALYPELREWLRLAPDPAVRAALVGEKILSEQKAGSEADSRAEDESESTGQHSSSRAWSLLAILVAVTAIGAVVFGLMHGAGRVSDGSGASGPATESTTTEIVCNTETGIRVAKQEGMDPSVFQEASVCDSIVVTHSPIPEVTWTSTEDPTVAPAGPLDASAYVDSGHVWSYENAGGYSYDMRIALGSPLRFEPTMTLADEDNVVGSACSIDQKTDVVIPFRWSGKATTPGYSTPISMRAIIRMINADYSGSGIAPFAGDGRILVEQYFSDGPECSHFSSDNLWGYGQNGGFSLKWSDPVQEGNEFSDTSVIVIKNYFTPATPDGDEDLLDIIGIDPLFGGDNSDAASVYTEQDMELGVYSTTMVLLNGKLVE